MEEISEGKTASPMPTKLISSGPITAGGIKKPGLADSGFAIPKPDPNQADKGGASGSGAQGEQSKAADEKKKFNKDEAKHIAFDKFLELNGALKVKEQSKSWMADVSLPLEKSFKPKPIGKNVTKMTMDTMPPSINMKRQEYRHVDYVQFMNSAEISNFVNYWLNSFEERVGWLYGYYAEDPDYELGIRAIVEAIYEPPQQGTYNNVGIKDDPFQAHVDIVASSLGLQKIGWIYTSRDHDVYMSPNHIMKAAQFQNEHLVTHQLGFKVPKFITVVLRRKLLLKQPKKITPTKSCPKYS